MRAPCSVSVHVDDVHGRGADEPGDEGVGGPVVEVAGGVDLLEQAVLEQGDAVAHGHGLDLVVGDVDGGGAEAALQRRRSGCGSARGAWRRGWTGVRPSGSTAAGARSPGPWRRAGAGRRRAPWACGRGTSVRSRILAASSTRRADLAPCPCRRSSARSPCCRPRTCAGRARSSGTPSRCRGPWAAMWVTSRSPMRIAPPSTSSSPASIRSEVDLPQPDGPTRTRNSPSAMSRSARRPRGGSRRGSGGWRGRR